ncbi:cell division protein FtsZ [Salinisphaera hydrothermalis]|uniref:Cell division protein FtsZ n=1 Tax=Salinisphaera hydrothermalis (strain C41B8) TaxID=1304275 RepID=A0A084IP65_SALHC|nr:cell division protein FtsZ [Salinisphaera hydrothermalis]KEZ78499.1 cell division protein FtsZ [Salinisphaera hydrothermalis C41B8]
MPEVFEFADQTNTQAVIKVIGVGGGGGNTVNQMVAGGIKGVDFICANTDAQHLERCDADVLVQLGMNVTRGLGAGADPAVGRQAAEEDRDRIRESIEGADMLFITAGMGGGTGTGAAPVVAEIAREMGILTLAVVTKPFPFERGKRMEVAQQGIDELSGFVDSLIVIPNEKLLTALGKSITLKNAFQAANNVLHNAVQGISDLITRPGMLNVDFADVRKVMSVQGMAMMGRASAKGEDRAREAAEAALASPLLDDLSLHGAQGLLVNVTGDENLGIHEFQIVNEVVAEMGGDNAEVIIGMAEDPDAGDEITVTVVATGLGQQQIEQREAPQAIKRDAAGQMRYEDLDRPTVIRQSPRQGNRESTAVDMDYFDVPAFLRNQAD